MAAAKAVEAEEAAAAAAAAEAAAEAEAEAAAERAAEGVRLAKIRAAREARLAAKERHQADEAALAASNNQQAQEMRAAKRAARRVAEAADQVVADASMKEGQVDESMQREREVAAHQGKASIISINPEKTEVLAMAPSVGLRPFRFARVFEPTSSQQDVYERCGRAAVADLINGQSGCILVYGQTGSGKVRQG